MADTDINYLMPDDVDQNQSTSTSGRRKPNIFGKMDLHTR